jgi:CBS domain-containing protein
MARDVVQLTAEQTMSSAATLLSRHGVSAAPVVDKDGSCIGILSATDFVRRESAKHQEVPDDRKEVRGTSRRAAEGAVAEVVGAYMSPAVQSIAAASPLLAAAKVMDCQHVHRLVVLSGERPIGVVSTMDIVAALLNAIDEMEMYSGSTSRPGERSV